jgi:hypothetical protein
MRVVASRAREVLAALDQRRRRVAARAAADGEPLGRRDIVRIELDRLS